MNPMENGQYIFIHKDVMKADIPGKAAIILAYLADRQGDNEICCLSHADIAEACGCSSRCVIKFLRELGAITKTGTERSGRTGQHVNVYRVNPVDSWLLNSIESWLPDDVASKR